MSESSADGLATPSAELLAKSGTGREDVDGSKRVPELPQDVELATQKNAQPSMNLMKRFGELSEITWNSIRRQNQVRLRFRFESCTS